MIIILSRTNSAWVSWSKRCFKCAFKWNMFARLHNKGLIKIYLWSPQMGAFSRRGRFKTPASATKLQARKEKLICGICTYLQFGGCYLKSELILFSITIAIADPIFVVRVLFILRLGNGGKRGSRSARTAERACWGCSSVGEA